MEFLSRLFRTQSRHSSSSSMSSTEDAQQEQTQSALAEFHNFPFLPPEIRLQIWLHALTDIAHDRVTVLRDPVTRYGSRDRLMNRAHYDALFVPLPKQDIDDRQRLLHINSESRSLFLPLFTGAFGIPSPTYHYKNAQEMRHIRWLLRNEPQFTRIASNHRNTRWLEGSLQYFNEQRERAEKFPKHLQLAGPIRISPPLWFNVDEDFLLLPYSRDETPYRSSSPEWNHCGTLHVGKVKKLAIEMSRSDWDHTTNFGHAVFPRGVWSTNLETGRVEWEKLQKVEEIAIWTREGCEVCWFSKDTEGVLEPGQWSFRLDTSENRFTKRFGERWSNMTWHIKIGQSTVTNADGTTRDKNICEMLRDWKPHASYWWVCKVKVTEKVPEGVLGAAWLKLKGDSPPLFTMSPVALTKVEGAIEGTWLGPSFNEGEESW